MQGHLFQRVDAYIHRLGHEHRNGRPSRNCESVFADRLGGPLGTLRLLDPIGFVVHSATADASPSVCCEEEVSLDKKPLERLVAGRHGVERAAVAEA